VPRDISVFYATEFPCRNPRSATEDNRRQPQAIREIDILWITAGLGCDGDTIAMTAEYFRGRT
jgi:hypothetical protein